MERDVIKRQNKIKLLVGDTEYKLNVSDISPETTLVEFLRNVNFMTGTKFTCMEGGCGSCIVAVTRQHPVTKKNLLFAVNSCLVSIYSCHGWVIHTIEGIGNVEIGYHPIQKTLAKFNGTQCGFCSPGMVMSMYPLYESSNLTMQMVEDSFGGNICRCTGYRPILTAFKSLAIDACSHVLGTCDIEDLKRCEKVCKKKCERVDQKFRSVHFETGESQWYKVESVNEIIDVLALIGNKTSMLVAGNTARGVYPILKPPQVYIDVTHVPELTTYAVRNASIELGGALTLTETMNLFEKVGNSRSDFSYLIKMVEHLKLVAHVAVRNIGTLAGNLSTKNQHPEFPSDIFLIFETVGATLSITNIFKQTSQVSLTQFLSMDMDKKVIRSIILPALDETFRFDSYKIMPVAQNAVAMVNAGFLLKLAPNGNLVQGATIIYGGINPTFVHSKEAEQFLVNKNIFDNNSLSALFQIMEIEINPDRVPPSTSPEFRRGLAISLFYKFILSIAPNTVMNPSYRSGGTRLVRPISFGAQDFQTNESLYPLTQPISKIEALAQTSGEAEYIMDIPDTPRTLHAFFVTAKAEVYSTIQTIDTFEALKLDGVVAFFGKNDIPGENSFIPINGNLSIPTPPLPEELFCSGTVKYYNQPIGVVVATSATIAEKGANLVRVTYAPGQQKPLLTIREILKANATNRLTLNSTIEPTSKGTNIKTILQGTFDSKGMYHYHMETQNCLVIPTEDALDIYPSTQWLDIIQMAVSNVLKIPENRINIKVRRLGGAFGGKITRNNLPSCAAALAAYKLRKPVRLRMSLTNNMDVIGKRFPTVGNYEVAIDENNVIQYLLYDFYEDYGVGDVEVSVLLNIQMFNAMYRSETFTVNGYSVQTDNAANIKCRAPGDAEGFAMMESIMEHIAATTGVSPLEVRLANMDPTKNSKIIGFINEAKQWSDYDGRLVQIKNYNKENRWRKKGLSLVPMTYIITFVGSFSVMVSIYAVDGTVAVAHGGVESGQGINTKVAQVCAYALGISLEMVAIKPSNNLTSPNAFSTSASITSEAVSFATLRACEILLARIEPIRQTMTNPTWKELVRRCWEQFVDLSASYMYKSSDLTNYDVYGVCVTEVEVDILTGQHVITRVDLLEDTGNSISPKIDIGQVEGAFIMGIGFWTTENLIYNARGKLLTNRTWTYKPPGAQDIPVNFRVKFPKNNPNTPGVLNSKAVGEPPLCLAISVVFAIRYALASARNASDPSAEKWFPIDGPLTVEQTFLHCLNRHQLYKL